MSSSASMGAKSSKQRKDELKEEKAVIVSAKKKEAPKKKKNKNFLDQFRDDNQIHAVDFMRIFKQYDKDSSGYLDAGELRAFLKDLLRVHGEKTDAASVERYLDDILREADIDNNSRIELGELALILPVEQNFLRKFPMREKRTKEEIDAIFSHYDKDGSGAIGGEELLALLRDMFQQEGQGIATSDLEEYADMVRELYDIQADGTLGKNDIAMLLAKY